MDNKTLKLYDTLIKYQLNDFSLRKNTALDFSKAMLDLSFENGLDAVEFLYLRAPKIFEYDNIRDDITVTFLNLLLQKNRVKTLRAILTVNNILSVFYCLNAKAFEGETLEILLSLLLSNKLEDADKLLKALLKNPYVNFGEGMRNVFEQYIKQLILKQGGDSLKPNLPKKTAIFLQAYFEKIKGEEKPLLLQRLKELL